MRTRLRRRTVATLVGSLLLPAGSLMLVVASIESGQASADSTPYELFCPGTPVGNIALNDVVTTGAITPADPASGTQFNVTNYQTTVNIPSSIASAAAALGNTSIEGQATVKLVAVGASPAMLSTPDLSFSVPLPSPIPASGVSLELPSPSATVGPFTATGGPITISQSQSTSLTLVVSGNNLNLSCTAYPNNEVMTGITTETPAASPISPQVATASGTGTSTTTGPSTTEPGTDLTTIPTPQPTGPYELYCPGTPVGNIALNGVTTSAMSSPPQPLAGTQFDVIGYQTQISIPSAIAGAAAALGNTSISGSASTSLTAGLGASGTVTTPVLNFNIPIPSPVPAMGLTITLPSPPTTVGPFNAVGGPFIVSQGEQVSLSLIVSGNTLNLSCTAYPDDSVPTGITTSRPTATPIAPVLLVGQTGTPVATTTTTLPNGSDQIAQAFSTLFDLADSSVQSKIAVIQDGASLEAALTEALASPLATSATGATVTDVVLLDDPTCQAHSLPSPCARVTYSVLGNGGAVLLAGQTGYAVSIDGHWLVAKMTICNLLGLFYNAEGKSGSPPGCDGSVPTSSTSSTEPAGQGATTTTAYGAGSTAASTTSTVSGGATKAASGSGGPGNGIVTASSGSLAFTGVGGPFRLLALLGAILALAGLLLLLAVDTPKRLVARLGPIGRDG